MEPTAVTLLDDAPHLYDSLRRVHYVKPRWRGWAHLLFFEASLVIGTLVVAGVHGGARLTAAVTYTAAVSGLFGASALYHRGNWTPTVAKSLQRLDHVMIFVLIAGTATPPLLLCVPSPYDVLSVVLVWTLSLAAIVLHLAWMDAPERLTGSVFLGLGWLTGVAVPAVWIRSGVAPAVLLVAGGVLYSAGAVSYHRRRPDPAPAVFGYHEVFHLYVCAAAACQYIAIACFIL